MEGFLIIESLDSLWFFSNLFSSRTGTDINLSSNKITNEEDPQKPTKPIVYSQQNESLKEDYLSPRKVPSKPIVHGQQKIELLSPKCTKCGEFAVKIESPTTPAETIFSKENAKTQFLFQTHAKKEDRSGSSSRRKKKNIKGEELLDLGFDDNWTCLRNYGVWKIGDQQHYSAKKMPPLSDGMAMKEHLKSWAYTVACTIIDECMFRFSSKTESLI